MTVVGNVWDGKGKLNFGNILKQFLLNRALSCSLQDASNTGTA